LPAPHSTGGVPPPTPITPSSPTTPATPTVNAILNAFAEDNLRGILAILVLAGCSDYNGLHREPLRKRFGMSLARISDRAYKLATAIREGIMSAAFEVVIVPPGIGSSSSTSSSKKGSLHLEINHGTPFDDASMEDAFAGSTLQDMEGQVLCTVELGLVCVRKVEAADGAIPSPAAPDTKESSRSPSVSAALSPVSPDGKAVHGMVRTISSTSSIEGATKMTVLDRSLLVKPKVMLDSVTKILQL
jgi:hypothetical protein